MASGTTTREGRISSLSAGETSSVAAAAIRRFIDADGSSHVRALAYQSMFVLLSGFIGLIGLASVLGIRQLRLAVQQMVTTVSPGPSGKILERAASHGASGGGAAALFGLLAAFTAATLAMAQVERSGNRLAGVDDRQGAERFARAAVLAVTAGLLLALGVLLLAAGRAVAGGFGWTDAAFTAWSILRWPLGIAVVTGAIYVLFRTAPREPIRPRAAVWIGAGVAVVLWVVFTAGLALYLSIGGGTTYGSLIGIVALLLWCVLTSLALHLGLAAAYELRSRAPRGNVRLPASETLDRRPGARGASANRTR